MKKKTSIVFLVVAVILAAVIWGVYYLSVSSELIKPNPSVTLVNNGFGWKYPIVKFPMVGPNPDEVAYSDIRDPGGIPQGLPVRLKIPVIGVNSAIEDALITADGRMDVPQGSVNVAWFALGPHPGRTGSAVIGGHFGISNGVKFVFYDLDKVKVGDKVYIEDDEGNTLAFRVRFIKLFERDADATTVFTSEDGLAHLNLITCEGVWNQLNGAYPQRRVVFTDAIPNEGPAPDSAIPANVPTVIVNPTTPAPIVAVEPMLPPTAITPTEPSSTPTETTPTPTGEITPPSGAQTERSPLKFSLAESVKSSFATPMDGIITSILIIIIVFAIFKIITI